MVCHAACARPLGKCLSLSNPSMLTTSPLLATRSVSAKPVAPAPAPPNVFAHSLSFVCPCPCMYMCFFICAVCFCVWFSVCSFMLPELVHSLFKGWDQQTRASVSPLSIPCCLVEARYVAIAAMPAQHTNLHDANGNRRRREADTEADRQTERQEGWQGYEQGERTCDSRRKALCVHQHNHTSGQNSSSKPIHTPPPGAKLETRNREHAHDCWPWRGTKREAEVLRRSGECAALASEHISSRLASIAPDSCALSRPSLAGLPSGEGAHW